MQRSIIINVTKVSLTVYDIHEGVHLWSQGRWKFLLVKCLKIGIGRQHLEKVTDVELKINVRALIVRHGHTDRRNLHTSNCSSFC